MHLRSYGVQIPTLSTSPGGDKIMDWGNPRSDRGTMRECAKPRQDQASQRTAAVRKRTGAFGKRTVPRLRGRSRRGRRAFLPKQIAVKQHACLLLFWNFFLVGQEKSAPFPFYQKVFENFCRRKTPFPFPTLSVGEKINPLPSQGLLHTFA